METSFGSEAQSLTIRSNAYLVVCQSCPEKPYLSLEVPATCARVERLTFTIESHDQGFGDPEHEERLRGGYESCNSFFEVATVMPSAHDRSFRLLLQYNRYATIKPSVHKIVWDSEISDHKIARHVRGLKAGDRIELFPRAAYPAWRNYVLSAEITMDWDSKSTSCYEADLALQSSIYSQLPVKENQIRILTLLPGDPDDDLICILETTSLDLRVTEYESLSYAWGDKHDITKIQILSASMSGDSQAIDLDITRNLHTALRYLRRPDAARKLWVDAICINQLDMKERGQQVSIMKSIYAGATCVLVWLGELTPDMVPAVNNMRQIADKYTRKPQSGRAEKRTAAMHDAQTHQTWFNTDCPLFEYDWFRRIWVLQEVYNAREIVVHCGHETLPWWLIVRVHHCLNRYDEPVRRQVMPQVYSDLFRLARVDTDIGGWTYDCHPLELSGDLLRLVIHSLDLDASDPRDKLFALTGLRPSGVGDEKGEIKAAIAPDYRKDIADVFADFTRWWIEENNSLQILSSVHLSPGRTWQALGHSMDSAHSLERPSWSLWHDGKSNWARGTLMFGQRYNEYDASKGLPPAIFQSENSRELGLRGLVIGRIEDIRSFPYFTYRENNDLQSEIFKAYETLFEPTNIHATWTSATRQDILQTELDRLHLRDHRNAHEQCADKTGSVECHPDCHFTLDDGSRGLCPPGARNGDTVAILFGGSVPYILRKCQPEEHSVNTAFRMVGECFLNGFMKGQAINQLQSRGGPYVPRHLTLV
ncbi:HET-domain-containing protein [Polychaeton citri CBS 116435]|uniref:HET-domain-containing protein n=1 Tax=Polychaeton citri CBS 116435 TaxID=1314669 RepID=A0A9P4PYR8_9PEZI|nr:HET-domain-containing protein [Polychaeton citri CBS 116435]